MDPPLGLQMQSLGRELNTVLARFHAVSRHAPSLAAAPDGSLEAVPCSVIDSWEVQLQKRLDACELDKQAAVQRCQREKEEVVESAKRHIASINATATHLERGLTNQKVTVLTLRLALRDADDDLRSQAQQLRMQLEENHALGAELDVSRFGGCSRDGECVSTAVDAGHHHPNQHLVGGEVLELVRCRCGGDASRGGKRRRGRAQ